MKYIFFNNIDKYEILSFFITGIDIGIITKDDLYDYILEQIEKNDSPDVMYCEIALILSKDWKYIRSSLIEILAHEGHVNLDSEHRIDMAYYYLIAAVGEQYENKNISLKKLTELFYKIAMAFDAYNFESFNSTLIWLDDEYDLAEQGIISDFSDIEKSARDIITEAKEIIKKLYN